MRTPEEHAVGAAIIRLMRGVVYRESDEDSWLALQHQGAPIRDHFATIGVDVVVDDTEGYAYLRSVDDNEEDETLPRLVMRRSLTYNVSLLLVLLRKRLVEFETSGSEGKLVLSRDQIVTMLRLFLADSTNEARVIDTVDTTIRRAADLGFLRPLRGQPDHWEVRRILKAYVDAQTMSDFAAKLADYARSGSNGRSNGSTGSDAGLSRPNEPDPIGADRVRTRPSSSSTGPDTTPSRPADPSGPGDRDD